MIALEGTILTLLIVAFLATLYINSFLGGITILILISIVASIIIVQKEEEDDKTRFGHTLSRRKKSKNPYSKRNLR